jgi:type II secretory pathway component GspD/PulD (secretin)
MLRLFARESNFKILSRPSIYAQNNVKATISSGQRIAIPTSTLTSGVGFENGLGGAITSNIEFRDVVLKLEVIPLINSDNQVTLKIAQVNDNVVGSQSISGNEIPTLSTQELITTVTINGGETVVLGGLITERADESVTGLPGIRRIPLLGKMLGSTDKSTSREETLIFIQPHIIDGTSHRTPTDLERGRSEVLDTTLAFAAPAPETLRAEPVTTVPQKRFFNFRMNSRK